MQRLSRLLSILIVLACLLNAACDNGFITYQCRHATHGKYCHIFTKSG